MTVPIHGAKPVAPGAAAADPKLRKVATQLEGQFVSLMFQAMRETAPQGEFGGGSGEEIFTSMLDSRMADAAPRQWSRGIATAIVRQLQARGSHEKAPALKGPAR